MRASLKAKPRKAKGKCPRPNDVHCAPVRRTKSLLLVVAVLALCGAQQVQNRPARLQNVGGEPPLILRAKSTSSGPHFTEVVLLPGRGMNVFQIKAFIPGLGEQDVIASPSLTVAAQELTGSGDDFAGVKSFKFGGAILVPWANRIRGQLMPDGRWIKTEIAGHQLTLPADWSGKKPGAEKHAIHGLILESKFQPTAASGGDTAHAVLHAGSFQGHWPSTTEVAVDVALSAAAIDIRVTAKNTGQEASPIGIGWHPYFAFPSGKRQQAELSLPARQRTVVNNYDDVFPTGQVVPVAGTEYDFFDKPRALGQQYLDDCFLDLARRDDGAVVAEIADRAAKYGLRIVGLSREIESFQVYAPPDKQFVALEPQFNLADPFNRKIWGNRDTGMVMLKPGESVAYHVRLELFTPAAK